MSDLRLNSASIGEGTPFVIVHGYTGSSADFAHLAPEFADLRRVVLVDQLGHGESPRVGTYTYDVLTDALVGFIRDELEPPVDLLGHSLGGRVTLPIAIHHPELVRSLVLMDTWADQPDRGEYAADLAAVYDLPDDGQLAALNEVDAARPDPERPLIDAEHSEEWETSRRAVNTARLDPEAVRQLGRFLFVSAPSVLAEAAQVRCPTTVIVGEYDEALLAASERIAATIPRAQLTQIIGGYHSPQLTHPHEWVMAVRRHLVRTDRVYL